MITPTGNQRSPYDYVRQNKNNSGVSFAELLQKSAAGRFGGTAIPRSAVVFGEKEEPVELPSWMGVLGEVVYNGSLDDCIEVPRPEPTHPESIRDIPPDKVMEALTGAMDTVADMDFTGKEKTEIYDEINAIYESYLGKDFREPGLAWDFKDAADQERMTWVSIKYHESMKGKGVDLGSQTVRREVMGFADMTNAEIKEALRARFPKDMTLRQCLIMAQQLGALGADDSPGHDSTFMSIIHGIGGALGTQGSSAQFDKVFAALLDLPADYDAIQARYAEHVVNDYTTELSTNIDDAFEKLIAWVGGSADTHGEILELMRGMMESGELRLNNIGVLWFTDFPT